ncbi:MAG: hypothetical protein UD936_00385 [Acutalibacteraceae bacterium]|nr:hypothetical protein [Acutalibacteraceae bacterium]
MKAKNKKNKLLIIICSVIIIINLIIGGFLLVDWISDMVEVNYTDKMLTMLSEKSEFKANELFEFEFDRAYVLLPEECYIPGYAFAEKHNLDISIDEVGTGDSDGIRRIIFVDEKGDFVYCFKFWLEDLKACEYGMIMYPDTVIKRYDEAPKGDVMFEICSDDYF